jgi:hypothetical protein
VKKNLKRGISAMQTESLQERGRRILGKDRVFWKGPTASIMVQALLEQHERFIKREAEAYGHT